MVHLIHLLVEMLVLQFCLSVFKTSCPKVHGGPDSADFWIHAQNQFVAKSRDFFGDVPHFRCWQTNKFDMILVSNSDAFAYLCSGCLSLSHTGNSAFLHIPTAWLRGTKEQRMEGRNQIGYLRCGVNDIKKIKIKPTGDCHDQWLMTSQFKVLLNEVVGLPL